MAKNILSLLLVSLTVLMSVSCDSGTNRNMVWSVVENTQPAAVRIDNRSTINMTDLSVIYLTAPMDDEGDATIRCINYPVEIMRLDGSAEYHNPQMGYSISKIDNFTLRFHFDPLDEEKAKGGNLYDRVILSTSGSQSGVLNTFFFVTRSKSATIHEKA